MTPTLRSSNNDTRESALAKAGAWYDSIGDGKIAKFATAIGQADDVSCEDMIAAIDQGRLMAVEPSGISVGIDPTLRNGSRWLS
jgi:hypothetical protein